MITILGTPKVEDDLDNIYTDYSIAYVGKHFSKAFTKWNYDFCSDVITAIKTHSIRYTGTTCRLVLRYTLSPMGRIVTIIRCDIDMTLLRNVERDSNIERIENGLSSVPPSMFLGTPPVNVSKSPRYWPKPTKTAFVLPPKTRVLKGEYFNGLRVGYHHREYTILDAEGKPLVEAWFDKKPRFFKYPFGKLGIIAHVSYQKELYAISMDGKMYDMNKMWKDAYLYEVFIHIMNNIINETFNSYKRQMLFESRSKVIRLNETQLCNMIHNIINKLIV